MPKPPNIPNPVPSSKKGGLKKKIFLGLLALLALLVLLQFLGIGVLRKSSDLSIREKPGVESRNSKDQKAVNKEMTSQVKQLAAYLSGKDDLNAYEREELVNQLELSADEVAYYRQQAFKQYGKNIEITASQWEDILTVSMPIYKRTEKLFEQVTYIPSDRLTPVDIEDIFRDSKMEKRFYKQFAEAAKMSVAEVEPLSDHEAAGRISYWARHMK